METTDKTKSQPSADRVIDQLELLTFPVFIKCIADRDYSGLVLEGTPDEMALYVSWQALLSKFYEEIGDKKTTEYIKRVSKMLSMHLKIVHTSSLCEAVATLHGSVLGDARPDLVKQLTDCLVNDWGYTRKFTAESMESDLKFVRISIGTDKMKLKEAQLSHEAIERKKVEKGEQMPPKKYWHKQLHAIEAHKKIVFDKKTLNMYDFALYLNELAEHSRELQAITSKKTKKNGSK
jgi:hypothetical protein